MLTQIHKWVITLITVIAFFGWFGPSLYGSGFMPESGDATAYSTAAKVANVVTMTASQGSSDAVATSAPIELVIIAAVLLVAFAPVYTVYAVRRIAPLTVSRQLTRLLSKGRSVSGKRGLIPYALVLGLALILGVAMVVTLGMLPLLAASLTGAGLFVVANTILGFQLTALAKLARGVNLAFIAGGSAYASQLVGALGVQGFRQSKGCLNLGNGSRLPNTGDVGLNMKSFVLAGAVT
jgi:hypothetical protein